MTLHDISADDIERKREWLVKRANKCLAGETNAVRKSWFEGYVAGLRHANDGDVSLEERYKWLDYFDSANSWVNALGVGYRAGLTLEPRSP